MISNHAVPLPEDLSYCMDQMLEWGHSMDYEWFSDVVGMLSFTVEDGIPVNKRSIIKDAIEIKMKVLIHTYIGVHEPLAYLLKEEWKVFFDTLWETTTQDFQLLTDSSTQYMNLRLSQQNLGAFQAVVQPVVPRSNDSTN
jgi:hypothetical protein